MSISSRIRAAAIAALLTAAAAAPPVQAAGDAGGEIVPRRDGSKATQVVTVREPVARADRFDWGDAAVGAGASVAALLLAAAAASAARRRHPGRRAPQPAGGS
jgi:hypothetical protein